MVGPGIREVVHGDGAGQFEMGEMMSIRGLGDSGGCWSVEEEVGGV